MITCRHWQLSGRGNGLKGNKEKIFVIFGTRPEAIKMAPVITKLRRKSKFKTVVCVTAQHRHMLDQVLKIFNISPVYDLDIMKQNQDLFDVTSNVLQGLKKILKREKSDLVIVQGDTTTAFVAGLAAYYLQIPIAHIEAGLRTYDKYSPFPEEKNRHLLSALADFHFAPTEWAKSNLLKEGTPPGKIWVTGNTVIDALLMVVKRQNSKVRQKTFEQYFNDKWNLSLSSDTLNSKLILVTGHRRENFGESFQNICLALKEIAERRKDVVIVYPAHLNPNVQRPVKRILNTQSNIYLMPPLEYESFVFLMRKSYIILTDSGGIQEEAPSLGKPVLIMRNTSERPEGIKAGAVKLVGTNKETIVKETMNLLDHQLIYGKMSKAVNPYGDGNASEKVVRVLEEVL
jgi:UDP-N-acetylglucosamine 2-epimerase (non-hydrolysing)